MSYGFPAVLISLLSSAIADQIPDNNQLNLLGSIFNQLGDTLATIASARELNRDEED